MNCFGKFSIFLNELIYIIFLLVAAIVSMKELISATFLTDIVF